MAKADQVTVGELIDYVTDELAAASKRAEAKGSDILALTDCELTLSYTTKRSQDGGVDLRVASGSKGSESEGSNRITLKFSAAKDMVFFAGQPSGEGGAGSAVGAAEPAPARRPGGRGTKRPAAPRTPPPR